MRNDKGSGSLCQTHTQTNAHTIQRWNVKSLSNLSSKCQSPWINFLISGGRKQTGAAEEKTSLTKEQQTFDDNYSNNGRVIYVFLCVFVCLCLIFKEPGRRVLSKLSVWYQSVNTPLTVWCIHPHRAIKHSCAWSNKTSRPIRLCIPVCACGLAAHSPYNKWQKIPN